jgi:hypothetical protein
VNELSETLSFGEILGLSYGKMLEFYKSSKTSILKENFDFSTEIAS